MVPFRVKCKVKGTGAGRSTEQHRSGHMVLTAWNVYWFTAEDQPTETGGLDLRKP